MSATQVSSIAVLIATFLLAGCAVSGPPPTDEARCEQAGGTWRTTICEHPGGGGY